MKIHIYGIPLSDSYDPMFFRSQLVAQTMWLKTMILSHSLVLAFDPGQLYDVYHCLINRENSFYTYSWMFYKIWFGIPNFQKALCAFRVKLALTWEFLVGCFLVGWLLLGFFKVTIFWGFYENIIIYFCLKSAETNSLCWRAKSFICFSLKHYTDCSPKWCSPDTLHVILLAC